MNILGCSIDFRPKDGGISTYSFEVLQALKQQGHQITVAASLVDGWEEFDRQCEIPIVRTDFDLVPMSKNYSGLKREMGNLWSSFKLFRRLHRKKRFDCIICFHWRIFGPVSLLLFRLTGLKYFLVGYGLELAPYKHHPIKGQPLRQKVRNLFSNLIIGTESWIRRSAFSRAACVFTCSRFTGDIIHKMGIPNERIQVTACGVDPALFAHIDQSNNVLKKHGIEGKKVILTISRLIRRKGIDVAIRALPKVLERVADAVYVIVGRGNYEKHLRKLVNDHGLEDKVIFAGYIPDEQLCDYYSACDLFLLPCRELPGGDVEGFGIVFLEANVCSKPVVAGRSGGVTEAVQDQYSGLLVDPCSEDAVADAVVRLLNDPEYSSTLGRQGRQRVLDNYTWELVGRTFHETITRIVSDKDPAA